MDKIVKKKFIVRKAEASDMQYVHQMIQELADFEEMSSGPELSVQDLIRDAGLDGSREVFQCYIAEVQQTENSSSPALKEPVGFANCSFTFSTWQGKSYYMQNFYIKPEFRNQGVGRQLFIEISKKAKEFGCKRLDFHVLGRNPARKFYELMGAKDLTELEDWHLKHIGYSICFFSYNMWQEKSFFMEDLYIKPEYRNQGVGEMFLKEVIRNAKTFGCQRVDFHVLGWNPARKFYEKMGATDLRTKDWHYYRLDEDALNKLTQ